MITLELTEEEARWVEYALHSEAYADYKAIQTYPGQHEYHIKNGVSYYPSLLALRSVIKKLKSLGIDRSQPSADSKYPSGSAYDYLLVDIGNNSQWKKES